MLVIVLIMSVELMTASVIIAVFLVIFRGTVLKTIAHVTGVEIVITWPETAQRATPRRSATIARRWATLLASVPWNRRW